MTTPTSRAVSAGAPRVLVSVLHYNAPTLAVETIRSFRNQTLDQVEIEVVDSASRPDMLAELRRLAPDVRVRVMRENLGYAGGNNDALLRGRRDSFDYVVVSNHDIEVDAQAIEWLVQTAAAHPDAGVVGAIDVIHATGETRAARGEGFSLWRGRERWLTELLPEQGYAVEADYVQGAMVMFTRAAVEAGVLFDERIFMYYDEIDLGFALRHAGLKAYLDQRVRVYHKNDGLSFSPVSGYFQQRNRLYLVKKYGRWYHRVFYHLYAGLVELPTKLVVRTVQGRGRFARACVKGHVDGIAGRMGSGRVGEV